MKLSQDTTAIEERSPTTTEIVGWAQALTSLHARIAPRFTRREPRRRALAYLQGIMSDIPRKTGWQLAEHAREGTPYGMQRLLSAAVWDDRLVREDLREYVYEHLGTCDAILVIDETSFPKRGEKSAGVQVQYCGTTGLVENCQVAVFLDYVTAVGHTLIDAALYIPKEWIDDQQGRREAGIPDSVSFKTKCEYAQEMVERVWKAKIPIVWVVADTVYGNNLNLRTWLEAHGYHFVLAVACNEPVSIRMPDGQRKQVEVREVEALLLDAQDWQRLSMSDGTKGPRLFDWAYVPILHQWEEDGCHWLLIRRCIDNASEKAYYFVFGIPGTTLQEMVKAIGKRWRIEDDFETSKDLGLDQYQVRCWTSWYRHITLVMLAHAYLSVICSQAQSTPAGDGSLSVMPSSPSTVAPVNTTPPAISRTPLPILDRSFTCSAALALPSPPVLIVAPLTVPEVRHVLGTLVWPPAANAKLVLSWSWWRRCHRGRSSYYHTKRRLEAG